MKRRILKKHLHRASRSAHEQLKHLLHGDKIRAAKARKQTLWHWRRWKKLFAQDKIRKILAELKNNA